MFFAIVPVGSDPVFWDLRFSGLLYRIDAFWFAKTVALSYRALGLE